MKLRLFNTLFRKKEVFKPLKNKEVGMYSCGPTVYWYQHIGNMRAYVFADILKRVLKYNGYDVKHVINVTDVGHLTSDEDVGEDKIEQAARKEGKTPTEIADFYFKIFKEDLKKLNVLMPDVWPRASEHVKEQISLIKKLEKKGFTYRTSDGIYFNSAKFKDYGKLARLKISGLKAGKRIAEGEKRSKTDFALWKFSSRGKKRQQEWESPWGVGFPGWHLECSAMSMKYLGKSFDIHTGGEEHIPVHHTNEIAQSEAATGKPFVRYWLHFRWLLLKGEKMAKSKGEVLRLDDLEKQGYKPEHFRYLMFLTHYRKNLNFDFESLDAAKTAFERLKRRVVELRKEEHEGKDLTQEYSEKFLEAINEDLNLSRAVQIVWKMIEDFDFSPSRKLKLLEKFDSVFGFNIKEMKEEKIKIPLDVRKLIEEREEFRRQKKWEEADAHRERIKERGFLIEDSSEGPVLRKVE